MSKEERDLKKVKERLLERKGQLEETLTQMTSEQVSDGQVQDPGDQALSATLETLKNSLQNTEVAELRRITTALEKIENGTYGICGDCGDQIGEKRLKMFPNAQRCLVCQEAFEEGKSRV